MSLTNDMIIHILQGFIYVSWYVDHCYPVPGSTTNDSGGCQGTHPSMAFTQERNVLHYHGCHSFRDYINRNNYPSLRGVSLFLLIHVDLISLTDDCSKRYYAIILS